MARNYGEEFGWELGVDYPIWADTEIRKNNI